MYKRQGHDYAIGIDSDGKMYRQDVAEENGEIEPYPIDDVIDTVSYTHLDVYKRQIFTR